MLHDDSQPQVTGEASCTTSVADHTGAPTAARGTVPEWAAGTQPSAGPSPCSRRTSTLSPSAHDTPGVLHVMVLFPSDRLAFDSGNRRPPATSV